MSLLNNPLVKNLIKSQLPEIIDNLDDIEGGMAAYIKSFELQPGETHTVLFTEIDSSGRLYFCIGAFCKKEMVRVIEVKPAKAFVKELVMNALKSE